MIKRENVWNVVLASVIAAIFAVFGWLASAVIQLQNQYAAETAEKELRVDVTDIMNDVDKRLAVIEAIMVFRDKTAMQQVDLPIPPLPSDPIAQDDASTPDNFAPNNAAQRGFNAPRYDLRSKSAD